MPVAIRLSRIGTKSKPFYRVVVLDSRKKRDGAYLENIGTYNGLTREIITFKPERFDAWVAQGAQPSDTAKKIYRYYKQKQSSVAAKPVEKAPKATKAKARAAAAPEEQPSADVSAKV